MAGRDLCPVTGDGLAHFTDEHGVVDAIFDQTGNRREAKALVFAARDQHHSAALAAQCLGERIEVGRLRVIDPGNATGIPDKFTTVREGNISARSGKHRFHSGAEAKTGP